MTFETEPGVEHLGRYLAGADTYDRTEEATLISNGTWTVGLAFAHLAP